MKIHFCIAGGSQYDIDLDGTVKLSQAKYTLADLINEPAEDLIFIQNGSIIENDISIQEIDFSTRDFVLVYVNKKIESVDHEMQFPQALSNLLFDPMRRILIQTSSNILSSIIESLIQQDPVQYGSLEDDPSPLINFIMNFDSDPNEN